MLRSADSWEERPFVSDAPIEAILWDNQGVVHVSTSGAEGGVYSSRDQGATWNKNLKGDSRLMAKNSGTSVYAMTSDQGLHRTANAGSSWSNLLKRSATSTRLS